MDKTELEAVGIEDDFHSSSAASGDSPRPVFGVDEAALSGADGREALPARSNVTARPQRSIRSLLKQLVPPSECDHGVYFLRSGEEVVYVGKSRSVGRRLKQHGRFKRGLFDSALVLPVSPTVSDNDFRLVEESFIRALCPKLNRAHWDKGPLAPLHFHILKTLGFSRSKRMIRPEVAERLSSVLPTYLGHALDGQTITVRGEA